MKSVVIVRECQALAYAIFASPKFSLKSISMNMYFDYKRIGHVAKKWIPPVKSK